MSTLAANRRHLPHWAVVVLANAIALAIGLAVTAIIVSLFDKPVGDALGALWDGAFGSAFAIGNTLNKSASLLLVALGFIVARKAGLVSIGGEGQIYIGGLFAVATGLWLAGAVPGAIAVTVAVVAGCVGGALWGAVAGVLKARFEVNEVIATLLLNFVAINIVGLMVQEPNLLREPVTSTASLPQSRQLPLDVRLPRLGFPDSSSRAHLGVALALVAVFAIAFLLRRTTLGFRIRMTGFNATMAMRTGVPVALLTIGVMGISGALCGLAGTSILLGEQFRLQGGFSPGYGFDGVAVALLARDSPFGAILAALLFGTLRAGGGLLEARVQVPQALVLVVQGVIILAVAGTAYWIRRRPSYGGEAVPTQEVEAVAA